jgi:hypothetical protein
MDRSKIVALAIALGLIVTALGIRWAGNTERSFSFASQGRPVLGDLDSEHSHASMLLFIDGKPFDFSAAQYQLKNDYVHFEDGDGITVHKHAKGVTLSLLFHSLGMDLTADCLKMADGTEYCSDGRKILRQYLNRKPFVDWEKYELRGGDKILVDYGKTNEMDLGLRLNSIPDLPEDL